MRNRTVWEGRLPWLVLVVGIVAVVLLHDDYGVTWDEGVQAEYGELALRYFTSGGTETGALEFEVRSQYGPVYQMIPAALYRALGLPKYPTRHLFTGLVALLALPGLLLFARGFRSPLVPVLAVLALVALPRFVGHAFNNSKDIPFAVAVVWLMLAAAFLFESRGLRWGRVAGCAVALAAALWARPGGFPLLLLWLGIAGAAGLWLGATSPGSEECRMKGGRAQRAVRASAALLAVVAIGWVLMVLPWPAAHVDPLAHPLAAMGTAAAFPVEIPVLFEGRTWTSGDLPRRYAAEMLAITTPPGLLALALLGGVRSVHQVARGPRGRPRVRAALLVAWVVLPLAVVGLLRPRLYDGIRHLLFLLPALALLAGLGGAWLVERASRPRWRGLTLTAVVVALLAPVPAMLELHPYQMTYFNAFVGGTGGADGRFETDYWVSSYGEAVRWINGQAAGDRRPAEGGPVRVLVAGTPFVRAAAEYAAAPGVEILLEEDLAGGATAGSPPIDYYLAATRYGLDERYPEAPVVHRVGRDGATFSVVKRLEDAVRPESPARPGAAGGPVSSPTSPPATSPRSPR